MISRFTNIKGVGRFHDCQFGGRHFSKNTIIFGQNTGGKSTLTEILWSFKTGINGIIEGRKTFGFNGTQQIEIFDNNNKSFKYPSTEWNKGYESIEIFDTKFIYQNIFEGDEITHGQQVNLHSIIIGIEGKKIADEIKSIQDELKELTVRKTAKTNEFNKFFKKEITFQQFTNLLKVENIDEQIEQIKAKIEIANNQTNIKSVFNSLDSLLSSIVNQDTKKVLSNSIEAKTEIVTEHILRTWKTPKSSKDFLQTGLSLTKDEHENCVFCGQYLNGDANKLLTAYSSLFSVEYKNLQSEISTVVSKFEKWIPVNSLESIKDKLTSIKLEFNSDEFNLEEIKEAKETINSEFNTKLKDIGYKVIFDKYDFLMNIFIKIQSQVEELRVNNILVKEINIGQLKTNLKKLEFSQNRQTKEWNDFVIEYNEIEQIQEVKSKKRDELREKLNNYAKDIFSIHFDTINKILTELQADFNICDFQPIKKIVGQDERIFALKLFNAHHVGIDEKSVAKPNFRNTLSYSDKRLLAFAFFYSLMLHDEKLNEKIIVFDDPFSSFDSERRTKTVELLANPHLIKPDGEVVEKSIKQLIIFTHESEFFKWLYIKLENPKALRLIPDGHTNGVKKSTLVDCDVEKEFIEDSNIKNLKAINDIYNSNKPVINYGELCINCRKVMEGIFRRKYSFDLEDEINKRKSIRTFVDKLKNLKVNGFENNVKYNNFISLCDNLNIELHDNTMENVGGNSLSILGDFLKLIKEI